MKKALSIALIGLALTLAGCTLPGQKPIQNPVSDNVACTMEAKICPDGSAVGRQGPNCEFAACPETINPVPTTSVPAASNGSVQIANPASVNCKEKGGTSEIITAPDGSQSSICKFPDGTKCEEWALFRNECQAGTINSANLQIYNNSQLGISFDYPQNWPVPVYQASAYGNGGYPAGEAIKWRLNLNSISKGACEGEDCYMLYIDGYQKMDSGQAYDQLKNDSAVSDLAVIVNKNGNKVIKYSEAGISDNRNAIIFGQNQTLILHDRTGNNPAFDQISSNIKFTK